MFIIGIDVGDKKSGYFLTNKYLDFISFGKEDNLFIREYIKRLGANDTKLTVVIEDIILRGHAGKTLRDTVENVGRFLQICEEYKIEKHLYSPQKYRNVLCCGKHTDAKIRKVCIERFGEDFLEEQGLAGRGKQNSVPSKDRGDIFSAIALCLYHLEYKPKEIT